MALEAMPTDALAVQWADAVFANQNTFNNSILDSWSFAQLREELTAFSIATTGVNISSSLLNPAVNVIVRRDFELGCQRGVSGTPTIFINGALTTIDVTWTFAQWQSLINGLLAGSDDL
jgi:protein-disulfide isomerase